METGSKIGCEAASGLEVGRTALYTALRATEVAETAQAAQTDSRTATETA